MANASSALTATPRVQRSFRQLLTFLREQLRNRINELFCMGCGASRQEIEMAHINRIIEEEIRVEKLAQQKIIKLLFLGPAESGKSTVLKQLRLLSDSEALLNVERVGLTDVIRGNVLQSIAALVHAMATLGIPYGDLGREEDAKLILSAYQNEDQDMETVPAPLCAAIKRLWADKGVQACYDRGNEFQLNDSAKYFLDDIDRISLASFRPTVADILRARRKTVGITQVDLHWKNQTFRIFDVAGQRSGRRKWIHCFDNVNSIIFVAAISEFGQFTREDKERNRLHDSIRLFSAVANSQWFHRTHMIVFLNKIDIFQQHLRRASILVAFPEYSGQLNYEESSRYIESKFDEKNRSRTRRIYFHRTCATDTTTIQFVLDSSVDMICANYLRSSGLY